MADRGVIRFDINASIGNSGFIGLPLEQIQRELSELLEKYASACQKYRSMYEKSGMENFEKKYKEGMETDEDVNKFHLSSGPLLELSDEIHRLKHRIEEMKRMIDKILRQKNSSL